MWSTTILKNDNGTYNATASFIENETTLFTWSATIKNDVSEFSRFAEEANKWYTNHTEKHKDDRSIESQINELLNSKNK